MAVVSLLVQVEGDDQTYSVVVASAPNERQTVSFHLQVARGRRSIMVTAFDASGNKSGTETVTLSR